MTNKKKLEDADELDIQLEIVKINDELSNEMWPPSWARTQKLLKYRDDLYEELKARRIHDIWCRWCFNMSDEKDTKGIFDKEGDE